MHSDKTSLTKHCLNCGARVDSKYCPDCGQRTSIERISGKEVLEEFTHFLTHIEHTFLYTTKELLLRPGRTIHQYLGGTRKTYQSPLSYVVVWVTVEWFIRNAIVQLYHYQFKFFPDMPAVYKEGNLYYGHHETIYILITVLVSALLLYVFMSRPKYNFYETLVICFYGFGTFNALQLLFFDLILGLLFRVNLLDWRAGLFAISLGVLWTLWGEYDFFKTEGLRHFKLRLITASLLSAILGYMIIFKGTILWLHYLKNR